MLHALQLQGRSSPSKEPEPVNDWTTAINIRFQRTQAVDNILSADRHGERPFASVFRGGLLHLFPMVAFCICFPW